MDAEWLLRFWTRVRDWANRQVKDQHMRLYHHARRCPWCLVWSSEVGGVAAFRETGERRNGCVVEFVTCKHCGRESEWHNNGITSKPVEGSDVW